MIVGIVGGGQLARMMALAGYPLGLRFVILDPSPEACAGHVAEQVVGAYDDPAKLDLLAERVDVVTFDFENVPADAARRLAATRPVFPPPQALEVAQDRLAEKTLFEQLDIPVAPYATVDSLEDLKEAAKHTGLPAVLKTRRLGYDGKGQCVLRGEDDLEPAWHELGGVPLLLEGFVDFEREVSILAARSRSGETVFYPLTENRHEGGILRLSTAPQRAPELEQRARDYAKKVLETLDYVGLLAIELFVVENGLVANEMAPRVHNSGHWTQDGAETSQFENHLRAIVGLPLGSTAALGPSAMVNFIGDVPRREKILEIAGSHLHIYGKSPRPGRKVGHVNICRPTSEAIEKSVEAQLALIRAMTLIES